MKLKRRLIYVACLTSFILVFNGCGKDDDDDAASVVPPLGALSLAVSEAFPSIEAAEEEKTELGLGTIGESDATDAYSTLPENFNSSISNNGGTFQRSFAVVDHASIFFAKMLVEKLAALMQEGKEVTTSGAAELAIPFITASGVTSLSAQNTFKVDVDDIQEIDHEGSTFFIRYSNAKGGYTSNAFVTSFNIEMFREGDESRKGFEALFICYGAFNNEDRTDDDGFELNCARFGIDTDTDKPQGGQLHVAVDKDNNIEYRAASYDASEAKFSLAMAGTFDKLLMRKRVEVVENEFAPIGVAEQFWLMSYSKRNQTFTDLGINNDTDSYSLAVGGTFTYTTSDNVCFGQSVADELTTDFPSLEVGAALINHVKAPNMFNPKPGKDLPAEEADITPDWTF